jgi:ferric-dicitrate binding protein FerR (iron transport regulator)
MNQNRQDIEEHILVQYLEGRADEELTAVVETWLNADIRNREHLDRLERIWIESGKISPAPVVVDVVAAWQRFSERIDQMGSKVPDHGHPSPAVSLRSYRYLWSIAAAIIILIGFYSIYKLLAGHGRETELVSRTEVLHDTLPDGTRITLNSYSKLVCSGSYGIGYRSVRLSGEAFFEVKKDAAHPFIVDAGLAGVRVLGTSFRVKVHPDRVVEVEVITGRVQFFTVDKNTGDTLSVKLNPGETGLLETGHSQPVLGASTDADGLYWANRSLDFRNMALAEVFRVLKNTTESISP